MGVVVEMGPKSPGGGLKSNPLVYISDLVSRGRFCTFQPNHHNHAHRLRLEKLFYPQLLRSSSRFFGDFWIQATVSLLKLSHGGYTFATDIS